MAKDVVEFLTWASEPTHDEGKLMGLKAMFAPRGWFYVVHGASTASARVLVNVWQVVGEVRPQEQ